MIAIVDPALLLPRPEAERDDAACDLESVLRAIREHRLEVPPLEEYWPPLWRTLGRALESNPSPRVSAAVRELRSVARPMDIGPLPTPLLGRAYGFRQLFEHAPLSSEWVARMTNAVARVALTRRPVALLVRCMQQRNAALLEAGGSRVREITRWVVRLHVQGAPPTAIPCVHHARNLRPSLQWTTRFDWRLPAQADSARYPFCPPQNWWRRSVRSVATHASRPSWADACGRYWARPNIPGGAGHHWDVFLSDPSLEARIGLSQLNIVEFGAPTREGEPGTIHHVPAAKRGRFRDIGWSCTNA